MLGDFALMSVLLVAAHLLRAWVPLLQGLLLPSALLAGILALAGGEQGLNLLPFTRLADGRLAMTDYPSELVAVLFATLYLGTREKGPQLRAILRNVGDTFFYNLAAEIGQYGAALLFGLLVLSRLFPDLEPGLAVLLPAGFAGGHGTAAVVGNALEGYGWSGATSIGYTYATLGLIVGILGGMVLINLGTRRGWTRLVSSPQRLPAEERRGFLPPPGQPSLGRETVTPAALDPLAWHVALVLVAFGGAHLANTLTLRWSAGAFSLPLFAVAMLLGAALQGLLDRLGIGRYVDRQVMSRIGSCTSDYLMGFGVASIKIAVVVEHALPIAVMSLFGLAFCLALFAWLGPRICRDYWFERSLFVYGWSTGTVGTSITLLRVVDPHFHSRTLQDYGLAYLFIAPLEIVLLVTVPPLLAHGHVLATALVLLGLFAACIGLSGWLIGWFRPPGPGLSAARPELGRADPGARPV
jgi:ESS family glutamate:Na+ symporter